MANRRNRKRGVPKGRRANPKPRGKSKSALRWPIGGKRI